ncbi:MAG TPA: PP2C family serine/threonine-protein phosphatase [Acidimicrobiales bacterium]
MTMAGTTTCPSCQAAVGADMRFCEACGAPIPEPVTLATCAACNATAESRDGYCPQCGARLPRARDHVEHEGRGVGAVTDRGRRHHRNEDAMAVDADTFPVVLAVVCDGVSTTERPDEASQAAVDAALAVLRADPTPGALTASYEAARAAVLTVPIDGVEGLGNPSCTFLAGIVGEAEATVANLGDCRAYWVGDDAFATVTIDDSWATEEIAAGRMTEAEAYADPRAHTITRWLGADADPTWMPRIDRFPIDGPGRFILCSDGLWNYAMDGRAVADAMGDRTAPPLAVARRLTDFANESGGHDNITVVVVDLPRPTSERAPA